MPIITKIIPQDREPIKTITWAEVISQLPERLEYDFNVWIAGKLARYGQTSEALIFLIESDEESSSELNLYFEKLLAPWPATVSSAWRDPALSAVRLYNSGRLIIDKTTLGFKELPGQTRLPGILTVKEVLSKLPATVEWKENIYLTGSIVRWGWSGNDLDIMIDSDDRETFIAMRKFFSHFLGWKVDVGNASMPDREPIYKYLIYGNGNLISDR